MNTKLILTLITGSAALAAGDINAQTTPGPQPAMCLRACWGARAAGACATMTALTRMIVHHTATASHWNTTSLSTSAANVRALQNADMDVQGFCDIEYHWMIDKFGNIFECRVNAAGNGLTKGAHDGTNDKSHGVSLMGYFHTPYFHVAPQVMLDQLYALTAWRMPSGWTPYGSGTYNAKTVGFLDGHRKVKATACPGDNIHPNLITENYSGGTMRTSVAALRTPGVSLTGRSDVFIRGTDNALYHRSRVGNSWSAWEWLGGNLTSEPTAVSWGPNRIDVFYRGANNALWHVWWDSTAWFGPEDLGGTLVGAPDAASWGVGHLDIYVRGTDNAVWHKGYSGGWTAWSSIGGNITSDPTVTCWGPYRVDVFARGTAGSLVHAWFAGSWSAWEDMGGGIVGAPDACSWGNGRLDVFVRGTDNGLYLKSYWGGWGSFVYLGGNLASGPSAASPGTNLMDVYYTGTDSAIYTLSYTGSSWTGVSSLGGGSVGGPDAASWTHQW